MRRFFLDKKTICSDKPTITGPDVKHIRTVLRLKRDDEIRLFDGEGSEYRARIINSTPRAIELSILDQYVSRSESSVEITIGQALLKAGKMDRIVRQVTELGATAFLPFAAKRSVPRPDNQRLGARRQRWETIATEALKQCGRHRTTYVGSAVSFEQLLEATQAYDQKVIFHNDPSAGGSAVNLTGAPGIKSVLALIGPEGGFTEDEVKLAYRHGFSCVSLGPRILKADTAAIAAATLLQYAFGDLGSAPKNPKTS